MSTPLHRFVYSLSFLILSAAVAPALAQTIRHVAPTGNDMGPCAAGSPCATLTFAIGVAQAGDIVELAAGSYGQQATITKALTIQGAGAGTDPAANTILTGDAPALTGRGLTIGAGVTNVTIKDLRVQRFAAGSGVYAEGQNDRLRLENVQVHHNTGGTSDDAGVYINGPVADVVLTRVDAQYNASRGIVVWNGRKHGISITDCTVSNNHFVGLELQDGTASGITISGNLIENNTDSGLGLVGLTGGAGPNRIFNNTVRNNGRFGIEVKLPDGTGFDTGDGSIVLSDNLVERTVPIATAEQRDLAGIAVYRRGWTGANADIPKGVVLHGNTVAGYRQTGGSTGFGIVVEGTHLRVQHNTVTDCDVAIQLQAGHLPYTAHTDLNGDQSNLPDQYFGRGNSPVGSGFIQGNTFAGNTTDERRAGTTELLESYSTLTALPGKARQPQLTVYPNPTRENLHLRLQHLPQEAPVTVLVYNHLGQLQLQRQLTVQQGQVAETVSLLGLAKGVYLLRLQVGTEVINRRVVVE